MRIWEMQIEKNNINHLLLNNFFFSSRRRHTRWPRDWSSDVCSSDLCGPGNIVRSGDVAAVAAGHGHRRTGAVINQVRSAETSDPAGRRWPRNKRSDDATAAYIGPIGY